MGRCSEFKLNGPPNKKVHTVVQYIAYVFKFKLHRCTPRCFLEPVSEFKDLFILLNNHFLKILSYLLLLFLSDKNKNYCRSNFCLNILEGILLVKSCLIFSNTRYLLLTFFKTYLQLCTLILTISLYFYRREFFTLTPEITLDLI